MSPSFAPSIKSCIYPRGLRILRGFSLIIELAEELIVKPIIKIKTTTNSILSTILEVFTKIFLPPSKFTSIYDYLNVIDSLFF